LRSRKIAFEIGERDFVLHMTKGISSNPICLTGMKEGVLEKPVTSRPEKQVFENVFKSIYLA